MMPTCPICLQSVTNLHGHHIVPQAKSKSMLEESLGLGPVIDICPTCHQSIHSLAASILAGKQPTLPPHIAQRGRLLVAMLVKAGAIDGESEDQEKTLTFKVTKNLLDKLDRICHHHGWSRKQALIAFIDHFDTYR